MPGGGWILLAALIAPLVLTSARPLAKKLGKGLKDIGEKLMEEADPESPKPGPTADKAKAEPATKKTAAKRPSAKRKAAPRKKPVNTQPKV